MSTGASTMRRVVWISGVAPASTSSIWQRPATQAREGPQSPLVLHMRGRGMHAAAAQIPAHVRLMTAARTARIGDTVTEESDPRRLDRRRCSARNLHETAY